MIRIKTLRRLIFLAEHLVSTYYTTGRSEYLSFDEHIELLDVENIAKALGVSERTAYDYVEAIRELYRTFRACDDIEDNIKKCEQLIKKYYDDMTEEPERPDREDMTEAGHGHCCDNMTDIPDKGMHTWLKYYDWDDKEPCCDDKTEVKEVDPAELRNKILEAFKAQGFEIAPDEAEIL